MSNQETDQGEEAQTRGPDGAFLLPGEPERKRKQYAAAKSQKRTRDNLQFGFNGTLVAATIALAILGRCQVDVAEKGAAAAKKAADAASVSADAAMKGADAASGALVEARLSRENAATQADLSRTANEQQSQDSTNASERQSKAALDASIEVSRNEERAWIGLLDFKLAKEPSANQDIKITFTLQNTGKTPAIGMNVKEYVAIRPTELESPDWSLVAPANNGIAFPGMFVRDIEAVLQGEKVTQDVVTFYNPLRLSPNIIWIRVRVEYDDVFGRHHWMQACGKHPPATPLERFDQCPTGIGVDSPSTPRN